MTPEFVEYAKRAKLLDENGATVAPFALHTALYAWNAGAAAEREACATLMEQQHTWITNVAAANLIRAR